MRFLFPLLLVLASCSSDSESTTSISTNDFLRDFPALTEDGLVNMVIEIPAGSNQKWEVEKEHGHLEWEVAGDTLRVVPYLPYPANYGMVPRTWLPIEEGGDDDPLDVILLGPAVERGTVVPVRLVGVLKMLDGGEQDDKLIAVDPGSWFGTVHTLDDLKELFPGVIPILTEWFGSYKGGNVVEIQDVENESAATDILKRSIQAYQELNPADQVN